MNNPNYDETISSSQEESLLKAMQIFYESEAANHRKIVRPDINVSKSIIKVFLVFFCYVFCIIATYFIFKKTQLYLSLFVGIILFFIIVVFTLKRTVITAVLLYQKLAPEKLRDSCVFTPSCSEYMLLAIDKYGLCKGLLLGIKRLLKCHPPNGGIDYP